MRKEKPPGAELGGAENSIRIIPRSEQDCNLFKFSIIPLHTTNNGKCTCGKPECGSPGKHPVVSKWEQYQKRYPTEDEKASWEEKYKGYNRGIVTGEFTGLVVLDVDGDAGRKSIKGRHLPLTWAVNTGKGVHYYFKHPGGQAQNSTKILPGLDIRADGGYVVAPGSTHVSGRKYEWIPGMSPNDFTEPAPCPKWFLDLLKNKKGAGAKDKLDPVIILTGVPEGERDTTLFRYACRLRKQGLMKEEALRLVLDAAKNCTPPFPQDTAIQKVESAWKYKNSDKEAKGVVATPIGFTDTELIKQDIPEVKALIPNILPEGLTILGGKAKIGKSWLALAIAVAVSNGGEVFGLKAEQGSVIYLALEDNRRRLKKRLTTIIQDSVPQGKLTFFTEWPRMDKQGLDMLREQLTANRAVKLVVIDVFQKIRPPRGRNAGVYEDDYAIISSLKKIADDFEIAILLLHHLNQTGSTDFTERLSGSTGIPGGVDTVWVIKRDRGKMDAVLHVTGRDVEELELAMIFDSATATWKSLGDAAQYRLSQERLDILKVVREAREPLGPRDVATILDGNYNNIRQTMWRMAKEGLLKTSNKNKYTPV